MTRKLMIAAAAAMTLAASTLGASAQTYVYPGDTSSSGNVGPGTSNNGSFFAYERNLGGSGQWGLRGEHISSVATYIDNFSASLAMRGKVLLVGGDSEESGRLSQVYDPDANAANAWSASTDIGSQRSRHTATLLPSGQVLVVGSAVDGWALGMLYNP